MSKPKKPIVETNQEEKIKILSRLFREMEADLGTRDLAQLTISALISTIECFKTDDLDDFCKQFEELKAMINNTEPKFGILNYYFSHLTKRFDETVHCKGCNPKNWKTKVIKNIKTILKEAKKQKQRLLQNANKLDVEGKVILIHDHSHTVQDILVNFKRQKKHFRVVIAEQDYEKSYSNIERMHKARIPFEVVPAYMLSHFHDQVDMVFFGALTLKDTMDFVMDPGAHGIISEFHQEKVPIYLFFNTSKFSLWKSKKRGEIFMHRHSRKHYNQPIEFNRIKYSHDRVPSDLFTKIITNKGNFTPQKLQELYLAKYEKYGLE